MADPTRYTPGFNYSGWEADHPTEPKPGAELDNDFAHIRHSIDETIRALKDVRRSDGKVQNAAVDFDALSPAVKAALANSDFDYEVFDDLLAKDANLNDLPDKAEAIENLGALARDANLEDLDDPDAALTVLGLENARVYGTPANVESASIPASVDAVQTIGEEAAADGLGRWYVRGAQKPGAILSANGVWFEDVGFNTIQLRIPTDFPTLQAAIDTYSRLPLRQGARVELLIESGHALTAGVSVSHGDYSRFVISAEAAEVTLAAGFSGTILEGRNAAMPTLNCLIDADNQSSGNGVTVYDSSRLHVAPGCGIKNVWGTGLLARYGSSVSANETIWTGAARNGNTGSGITAWGSYVDARQADCSNSGYYGAQAAHGGLLGFMGGKANDCGRHGIRATDAAMVDATNAQANRCAAGGSGFNVYAYEGGIINFSGGSANDNGSNDNIFAYGGSTINARSATATGAPRYGAFADQGSTINLTGATVSGGEADVVNRGGIATSMAGDPRRGTRGEFQQEIITSGGVVTYVPRPDGATFIEVDTAGGAASDNLDMVRPKDGYDVQSGDVIVLCILSSARHVTIRNRNSIGVGVDGFSAAQVVLTSSTRTVSYIRKGDFWLRMNEPA